MIRWLVVAFLLSAPAQAQPQTPVAARAMTWLEIVNGRGNQSFEQIAAFIQANPDWPLSEAMQRRAEEALNDAAPEAAVRTFFATRTPYTPEAAIRAGDIFARANDPRGPAMLRRVWVERPFTAAQETVFLARARAILTAEDHGQRIERLMWEARTEEAQRMLDLLPGDIRLRAQARVRLQQRAADAESVVAALPPALRADPGVIFDHARWLRRAGREIEAAEVIGRAPAPTARAARWWEERNVLARRLLVVGRAGEAYQVARNHGFRDQPELTEAEFLAGWIALRQRNDARAALAHFTPIAEQGRAPRTRARGAYWAGEAARALGDEAAARRWLQRAAEVPASFYGQTALARLGAQPNWPAAPAVNPADRAIARHEFVAAARALIQAGEGDRGRFFLLSLINRAETPSQHGALIEIAGELGRPEIAVRAAKRAALINGAFFMTAGWPTLTLPDTRGLEPALILALIRQESEFHASAISRAGARGLMQMMPATGRNVARELGVLPRYSDQRLNSDPNFNMQLGIAYLARRVNDFNGSYILALAAYNAGAARANAWLQQYGDPRAESADPIDWIERIPFEETRNYVQYVLESVMIYRWRLQPAGTLDPIDRDLRRPRAP